MPQNGESQQEYDYRICKTDIEELKSYTFVVSRFFKFNGYSMKDFGYNVYVYDKDGNYVNDPIVKEKCRGEFFENLKDVE